MLDWIYLYKSYTFVNPWLEFRDRHKVWIMVVCLSTHMFCWVWRLAWVWRVLRILQPQVKLKKLFFSWVWRLWIWVSRIDNIWVENQWTTTQPFLLILPRWVGEFSKLTKLTNKTILSLAWVRRIFQTQDELKMIQNVFHYFSWVWRDVGLSQEKSVSFLWVWQVFPEFAKLISTNWCVGFSHNQHSLGRNKSRGFETLVPRQNLPPMP